jgi:hydroxyacylglutathione hydrolase
VIDGESAVVIDPRRDAEIYYNKAKQSGAKIKYIFETHRNEDFITGSRELKRICGADIFHGNGLDFEFGNFISDNQKFELDNIALKAIETPGHTPESISLALYPDKKTDQAIALFSGDALFINDVGRTDFFPEEKEKYSEQLYNSIHKKSLPLGDHVVLYPAHGAGSVCGGGIADREISTLGYEKKNNPLLQLSKEEFIKTKVNEDHQYPPYFKKMEEVNLKGNDEKLKNYKDFNLITLESFKNNKDAQLIDIRSAESFIGTHIPDSYSIPIDMIGAYAGYFLDYNKPIFLIGNSINQVEEAHNELLNLGYDNTEAFLSGGVSKWETSGESLGNIGIIDANQLLKNESDALMLDVRKPSEWEDGIIDGARTIFLGDLPNNLNELDKNKAIITYGGSGKRATIAASILKKNGFDNVKVFMGSMKAYNAIKN